jgi:hypothetical protein
MKILFLSILLMICGCSNLYSNQSIQSSDTIQVGLERVIVEPYYIHRLDNNNIITYRIYLDLAEGYELQAIFGIPGHPLRFTTTTQFINDTIYGEKSGRLISDSLLFKESVVTDSWLTMGHATKTKQGVLKENDPDGSDTGFDSLKETDGLIKGDLPQLGLYKITLSSFKKGIQNEYKTDDGVISCRHGVQGPTKDNQVLIAQLSTDGELSFELNIQLITPSGVVEKYVCKEPAGLERLYKGLHVESIKLSNYEIQSF